MADPFLIETSGTHWLFYEDYDYRQGRIAVGRLDGTKLVDRRICLETKHHPSFPCVVGVSGVHYMVREQAAARKLWVWRATLFPDRWVRRARIARGRFHDPVLRVASQDSVEAWATIDDETLRVFRAATPAGSWNLVSKIARTKEWTRSAGLFFDGMRLVQETTPVYGRAIHVLNDRGVRVKTIEPT